jgi:hypothetical protein
MTIRFQAQIDDPHTESLLLWLEERYGMNWVLKIQALHTAERWLTLRVPGGFTGEEKSQEHLCVEHLEKPSASPVRV